MDAVMDRVDTRTLAELVDTLVARLMSAERRALHGTDPHDQLTLPQLRCLQLLGSTDRALTTQLARTMGIAVPTMTGRIDGLVARGLVERHPDTEDRRKIYLTITEAGRAQLAQLEERAIGRVEQLLAPLSAAQRARLGVVLQDLLEVEDA